MSTEGRFPLLTKLSNGRRVSTVRLPQHHGWYETTVVSAAPDYDNLYFCGAATEEQARANHDEMVAKWSATEESKR